MSAQPIIFFKKNKADYSDPAVLLTASEGSAYAPFVQKRSNAIGWMTTGSVDSNNTTLTCNFVNLQSLTNIILVGHNFGAYTIKYWNGSSYVDLPTTINVSGNTVSTTRHSFALTWTTAIQITITGTIVANSDKVLNQLIATELLGQFQGWPVIGKPTFDLNKRNNPMLSGKHNIGINVGGFSCDLSVTNWSNNADLTLIETLFSLGNGFLVWLSGGNQTQFRSVRQGYRVQDFFLMQMSSNYTPEWVMGLYTSGMKIDLSLQEVTV